MQLNVKLRLQHDILTVEFPDKTQVGLPAHPDVLLSSSHCVSFVNSLLVKLRASPPKETLVDEILRLQIKEKLEKIVRPMTADEIVAFVDTPKTAGWQDRVLTALHGMVEAGTVTLHAGRYKLIEGTPIRG